MAHNMAVMANLTTFDILATAPNGFASPRFPEIPNSVIREYVDAVYGPGRWAVDSVEFDGFDAMTRKLARTGSARFVCVPNGPDSFAIREASPVREPSLFDVESVESGEYPLRPERGPLGRWDALGERDALRGFLYSRANLANGRTFEVIRTGSQTLMRVCA